MIRAGTLRYAITIQQRGSTRDAYGQVEETWTAFLSDVRAAIEWVPGREAFEAAHRNVRVPTIFRIRHRVGITPAMRVLYDSRYFNITSVTDPDGKKEQLILTTEELVGETT